MNPRSCRLSRSVCKLADSVISLTILRTQNKVSDDSILVQIFYESAISIAIDCEIIDLMTPSFKHTLESLRSPLNSCHIKVCHQLDAMIRAGRGLSPQLTMTAGSG